MLRIFLRILLLTFICYQCQKDISLTKEKIPKKIDSLCNYKEFQSKKLFIVQQELKNNKNFIRVSTSEYFDKDSVASIIEYKDKIIVYYSPFFSERIEKRNIFKYRDLMYRDNILSIFHPRYCIFELTDEGNIINVKNQEMKDIFQYGTTKIEEEEK